MNPIAFILLLIVYWLGVWFSVSLLGFAMGSVVFHFVVGIIFATIIGCITKED